MQRIAIEASTPEPTGPSLTTISPTEIFAPLPPIPWLVQGLGLAPGRPALFAGYGFSGKSIAAQDLALAVASGRKAWGVYSARRGPVLHLDYEQGARLTSERYQRLARAAEIDPESLSGYLRVAVYPQLALSDRDAEETLAREAGGHALVIVDSLTCAVPAIDENSREIAGPLYMLGRVSEKTGATFLVIHHARKPVKDAPGGAAMAIRGSSAIFGAVDAAYVFSASKGEPTTVDHVRSPMTGITLPTFGLRIDDVDMDGNRRGGLRVRHLDAEEVMETPGDAVDRVRAEVLRVLSHDPDIRSKNELARRVRAKRCVVFGALDELIERGTVGHIGGAYRVREVPP